MTTSTCLPPQGARSADRKSVLASLATVASLFLAACGGNGDGAPPPPPPPPPVAVTQVPVSAVATDASLEMFAITLARTETTEPLTLDLVKTMPTSDSEDPIATP